MGVREIGRFLEQWRMDGRDLNRRLILAPTPLERERWHAIWLLAQGWTASGTAQALGPGRPHHRTMAQRLRRGRACGSDIRADRWFPPALDEAQQEELKEAVQQPPASSGIVMANWYWKVVRRFALERFSIELSRSSCLNWLHRLGFAFKRPKKRLLKADDAKREAFVVEYAALREEAQQTRARIFFADEAHFRADAELPGSGCLKANLRWWIRPARGMGRRPATIRRCVWRRARWNGWNWRATATPGPRLPSWNNWGENIQGRCKSSGTTRRPIVARRCGNICGRPDLTCGW